MLLDFLLISIAVSQAGSDVAGIRTVAVADGDDFILNGSKTFITNGWHSDVVIVAAKTDPTKVCTRALPFFPLDCFRLWPVTVGN